MRITQVRAENLKGRSFIHDLSAEVAIVGENFTGKTSIIDAIRLALIGYIPELGKLPKSTRQLMSDQFMSVHLELDNGAANADFEINETSEHSLPWKIDRKEIPLLNAASYFAMTERERYQYVFNIAKTPETFTAQSICDELRAIHFEQSGTEEAKKSMINYVADAFVGRSIQEGLQAAIDKMAELFKRFNTRSKDTQGAIRVMTELKNRQEAMAGNAKQFLEAERAAMAVARDAWDALNLVRRRVIDAQKFQERREKMKRLAESVNDTSETEKLERLIKEATATMKPLVQSNFTEGDLVRLRATVTDDTAEFNEYSRKLKEALEGRQKLEGQVECPYCGAKGGLDLLRQKLQDAISFNSGAKLGSGKRLEQASKNLAEAEADYKAAQEALIFNRQVNQRILGWQGQIDSALRLRQKWNAELEKEEKELAESVVEPVTKEEVAEAVAANTKAETDYKAARQRLKEAELLEQDIKRAAQAELEHQNAVAHVEVIKAVGKSLREKLAALVDAVFGDLLKVANGIVGEILVSPLAFHEGEVGRWDKHQWISHKTFSGTEQALTFVAIAAALSQGAPIRLLIFDELGRLDPTRRNLLINLLRSALKNGWLDQFIVAGAVELETLHPAAAGMQVIELPHSEAGQTQ